MTGEDNSPWCEDVPPYWDQLAWEIPDIPEVCEEHASNVFTDDEHVGEYMDPVQMNAEDQMRAAVQLQEAAKPVAAEAPKEKSKAKAKQIKDKAAASSCSSPAQKKPGKREKAQEQG